MAAARASRPGCCRLWPSRPRCPVLATVPTGPWGAAPETFKCKEKAAPETFKCKDLEVRQYICKDPKIK